jgi:hypothetical protein
MHVSRHTVQQVSLTLVWHCKCMPSFNLKHLTMAVRSKVPISLEQPLCWGGARGVAHNDGKRQSQLLLLLWRAYL